MTLNRLELCPKLTTLISSHNRLESVPNLDCCPELWKLDLSHNKVVLCILLFYILFCDFTFNRRTMPGGGGGSQLDDALYGFVKHIFI